MEKTLIKLDKKDKKILTILEKNSRSTLTSISKRVGLSKASISSRIKKIEKRGLIDRYPLIINYKALGLIQYRLYIKFDNLPIGFEKKLIDFLFSQGLVRWFSLVQGSWDLIMRVAAKDTDEFIGFEKEFLNTFGKNIKTRYFAIAIHPSEHYCTIITKNRGLSQRDYAISKSTDSKLSIIDYKLLYYLFENSRTPIYELAEKLMLSPDVISYHIKKLEKEGIIHGYYIRFNRSKLGYIDTKLILWLSHLDERSIKKLWGYVSSHPNISFATQILGPWDFEIDFDVLDPEHQHILITDLRSKFPNLIRDYTILMKIKEFEANPFGKLAKINSR